MRGRGVLQRIARPTVWNGRGRSEQGGRRPGAEQLIGGCSGHSRSRRRRIARIRAECGRILYHLAVRWRIAGAERNALESVDNRGPARCRRTGITGKLNEGATASGRWVRRYLRRAHASEQSDDGYGFEHVNLLIRPDRRVVNPARAGLDAEATLREQTRRLVP